MTFVSSNPLSPVKSIQRISATSGPTATPAHVTISIVDITKTVVMFEAVVNVDNANTVSWGGGHLTTSTNVDIYTEGTVNGQNVQVFVTVLEYR